MKRRGHKILAENLRRLRRERRVTQQQIANYLYIDRTTYTYYETQGTLPTINTLIKIAQYYDVTIDSLLKKARGNKNK